jgi:hypothetical protein
MDQVLQFCICQSRLLELEVGLSPQQERHHRALRTAIRERRLGGLNCFPRLVAAQMNGGADHSVLRKRIRRNFNAMNRPSRVSSAWYTTPIPPRPAGLRMRKWPKTSPSAGSCTSFAAACATTAPAVGVSDCYPPQSVSDRTSSRTRGSAIPATKSARCSGRKPRCLLQPPFDSLEFV